VRGLADLQRLWRTNNYLLDPFANGQPCWTLACRGDLNGGPKVYGQKTTGGAIDAKVTSSLLLSKKRISVVSGPTTDNGALQPFTWDEFPNSTEHRGQPNTFEFTWVEFASIIY